eukprot:m.6970 g.6970  ORF g.6970 m.6970 type:complete len:57 (-) comp2684_c0_seq1:356-526(-)
MVFLNDTPQNKENKNDLVLLPIQYSSFLSFFTSHFLPHTLGMGSYFFNECFSLSRK